MIVRDYSAGSYASARSRELSRSGTGTDLDNVLADGLAGLHPVRDVQDLLDRHITCMGSRGFSDLWEEAKQVKNDDRKRFYASLSEAGFL